SLKTPRRCSRSRSSSASGGEESGPSTRPSSERAAESGSGASAFTIERFYIKEARKGACLQSSIAAMLAPPTATLSSERATDAHSLPNLSKDF
ncbi:MAG: hypothetical protein LM590_10390, partial [Thermofilum sp.]|nr:hypothetical protein [Thermofilum sp.]